MTRQCSACKTSLRSCKTALASACVTDVGLRPVTPQKKKKMKMRKKKIKCESRVANITCAQKN